MTSKTHQEELRDIITKEICNELKSEGKMSLCKAQTLSVNIVNDLIVSGWKGISACNLELIFDKMVELGVVEEKRKNGRIIYYFIKDKCDLIDDCKECYPV